MKNLSGVLILGVVLFVFGCSKELNPDKEIVPEQPRLAEPESAPTPEQCSEQVIFFSNRSNNGDLYAFDPISLETSGYIVADSAIGAPRLNRFKNALTFAQNGDSGRTIFGKTLDTQKITSLIPNPAGDEVPDWSPSENKIAYTLEDHLSNYSLVVRDLNTGNEQVLYASALQPYNPVWSPDGSQIAFVLTDSTNNGDIAVINADGSDFSNLTKNSNLHGHPAWSPDGKRLLFYIYLNGNADLYTLEIESGDLSRLTFDPSNQLIGRYSSDGSKIAYGGIIDGDWEVFIMDADGNNKERITFNPGFDGDPVWVPCE